MNTNTNQLFDIGNGFYSILYTSGEHRTMRIKTPKTGNFKGRKLIGFLSGCDNTSDYTFFGELTNSGELKIWRNFANSQSVERLARIRRAVEIIASDSQTAGKAFAVHSGNCYGCGRLLTVPASVFAGLGPECAKKV